MSDSAPQSEPRRDLAEGEVLPNSKLRLAAIAATAIHNRLPPNYREDRDSQPDTAATLPSPTKG